MRFYFPAFEPWVLCFFTSFKFVYLKMNFNTSKISNFSDININESTFIVDSKVDHSFNDFSVCPFSGIKIEKMKISISEFKLKMINKKMFKLDQIKYGINRKTNDIDGDWVTIAVIIDKLPIKKTKNGKDYSIWKLSDLKNLETSYILMLFGEAHQSQWKVQKGSVIGLLNCKILPAKNTKSNLSFSIEQGSKLMCLGISKDLGYCKATKKNSELCNTVINLSEGNYCTYHIKMDYKMISSLRPELTSILTGFPTKNNFTKSKSDEEFYANKKNIFSEIQTEKQKDLLIKYQSRKETEAEVLSKQIVGNISIAAKNLNLYNKTLNNQSFSKENKQDTAKKIIDIYDKKVSFPELGKGLIPGEIIELNEKLNPLSFAKRKAIEIIKNIEIIKQNPNNVFNSKSNKNILNILNKVEENILQSDEVLNSSENCSNILHMNLNIVERRKRKAENDNETKKKKKEAIEAIMNRKSNHENEIKAAEIKIEKKYFDLMEKKEIIENRMLNKTQITVNIVICKFCQYTAQNQSDFCKLKNHAIIMKNAIKRFFKCKQCKSKTSTYNQIYPTKTCKCGSNHYEKTFMYNIENNNINSNKLLIRGEEMKFLNS